MPISDLPDPESPHADTRMLEFVERRREEQARARRERIQIIAIIALGLIGIVLTVSNAVLVSRLVATPVTPPVVVPPPVRSAVPTREPAEPPAPSAAAPPKRTIPAKTARRGSTPSPQPSASASSAPSQGSEADAPAARPSESAAPAASALPPAAVREEPPALPERVTRSPRHAVVPDQSPPSAETLASAVEMDPALRTARWMIRTYGPLDAEGKALAAAEFYSGEEGEFWRRVVAHVRAER
jgi:hypothetical protein